MTGDPLDRAVHHARGFLDGLGDRPVGARAGLDDLRQALDVPLPEAGADPAEVIDELAAASEPGLVASAGPRYFGFVVGGALPAALAADWLVAAWDQNAGLYASGPAAAVAEEVAGRWLLDLLGLPADAGFGFTTGATMANATGLAAGRHAVLARAGWDVEADGLAGAPPVTVIVGEAVHVSALMALRLLGFGTGRLVRVPADDQGRMRADELARRLADVSGPAIVCAQAGEVNTGASDPLAEVTALAREHGAWCHVDGAFGLWAAAAPARAALVAGHDRADSWATDGHKWLNVPYDCGVAFVADPEAQRAAMGASAAYLGTGDGRRNGFEWVPDASRRARGVPVYAALRALGRAGVADLVERFCRHAERMADLLAAEAGVEILNDVVLNQVLVAFGDDAVTEDVVRRVQADGTLWLGGTRWQGRAAMRISVSGWATTDADIERSAGAILACARAARREGVPAR